MNYPCVEVRKLSTLKAHPDAVRSVTAEAVYNLRKSHDEFGLLRLPVLNVRTGNVIDGDHLITVLRDKGVEEVQVWCVDIDEAKEDIAHLALQNHCGEWMWEPVSVLLRALKDAGHELLLTGFHPYDISPLTQAEWSPVEKGPFDGSDVAQQTFFV